MLGKIDIDALILDLRLELNRINRAIDVFERLKSEMKASRKKTSKLPVTQQTSVVFHAGSRRRDGTLPPSKTAASPKLPAHLNVVASRGSSDARRVAGSGE